MTANDRLYEKLSNEYNAFIDELEQKPVKEILVAAYEKVWKEEIVNCFEKSSYSDEECEAFLAFGGNNLLDAVYAEWLKNGVPYLDSLEDCIYEIIEPEIQIVKTLYGEVEPGDSVIAAGNNDYRYLVGTVKGIEGGDVHVDFTAFNYPPERIAEIEKYFSELYGEQKTFGELPLDDVIMAPDMLISISNLSREEIENMGSLRQNCEAFCNCFPGSNEPQSEKHGEFLERIKDNLEEYQKSLLKFGNQELIDMADKISAVSDAYRYLNGNRGFEDFELDFFLQFKNPLEILADEWCSHNSDSDEISYVMDGILRDRDNFLNNYPLVTDPVIDLGELDSRLKTLSEKANELSETVKATIFPDEKHKPKPKKPTKKPIAEQLSEAGEEAKQLNAQNVNNNTKNKKKEIE